MQAEARSMLVSLEAVPGCVERMMQPLTVMGSLPVDLHLRQVGSKMWIRMRVDGLSAERIEHLVFRLRASPSVVKVRLATGITDHQLKLVSRGQRAA